MWRTPTDDDLQSSINGEEWEAVQNRILAYGQGEPVAVVRQQVTSAFRVAIRSGPGNRLDPDETTLPEEAIFHATAVLRFRLLTRFASELIDEDRRQEKKDADAWLVMVRKGIEKIQPPDGDPTESSAGKMKLLTHHERQATREKLSGL